MATFPDNRTATAFFSIDRSELSAKGFGHVVCFIKIVSPGKVPITIAETYQHRHSLLCNALRNTKSSIRPHPFETYSTSPIGLLLFCHKNYTHRSTAAIKTNPAQIPAFESIQREIFHQPPHAPSFITAHLLILCDAKNADTLANMFSHAHIESPLGTFVPLSASTSILTQYYESIAAHNTFIIGHDGLDVEHSSQTQLTKHWAQNGKPKYLRGSSTPPTLSGSSESRRDTQLTKSPKPTCNNSKPQRKSQKYTNLQPITSPNTTNKL